MMSEIEHTVFAHTIVNPPYLQIRSDIDLTVTNSKGRIRLVKRAVNFQTEYSLTVVDPSSLGVSSYGQHNVKSFVSDMVLACNLTLRKAALSTTEISLTEPDVKFQQKRKFTVEMGSEGQHITVAETPNRRERIYFRQPFPEEIDENQILSNLILVSKTDRYRLPENPEAKLVNLVKSLGEYESAMSTFDRLAIFKHLFNSLELAVNWNGSDRKGPTFDAEAAVLLNILESDIFAWREFYNRTKHVDATPSDVAKFVRGMENLPGMLMPLRIVAETGIIKRLNSL